MMNLTKKPSPLALGTLFESEAVKLCGISPRTWRAWKAGTHKPPASALGLLRLHAEGRALPETWEGWHFTANDLLSTPYGENLSPADILKMFWYMQELRTLRGQMRRLTREFDLTPKPTGPAIDEKKSGELPPP